MVEEGLKNVGTLEGPRDALWNCLECFQCSTVAGPMLNEHSLGWGHPKPVEPPQSLVTAGLLPGIASVSLERGFSMNRFWAALLRNGTVMSVQEPEGS